MKITKGMLKRLIKEEMNTMPESTRPQAGTTMSRGSDSREFDHAVHAKEEFDPARFVPELYNIVRGAAKKSGSLDVSEKKTLLTLLTHLLDAASKSTLGTNATLKRWLGLADEELVKIAAKK
jgi:hypothetical protein